MSDNRTFVSYSRGDSEFALKLASDLRANGASIWLDQLDIAAGSRWDSAVEEALRACSRVLVILSPKAVSSNNVLDEVSFALGEGKTVVPVLMETCTIPMRLHRVQHVDFTRGYDAGLARLLSTLGVARAAAAETPPPRAAAPPPPPPREPVREEPPRVEPRVVEPERAEPEFSFQTADSGGRNGRTLAFAGVAAAVLVLGGIAIWSSSGGRTEETPSDVTADATPPAAQAPTPAQDTPSPAPAQAAPPPRVQETRTAPAQDSQPVPSPQATNAAPSNAASSADTSGALFGGAINPGRNPLSGLKGMPRGEPLARPGNTDAGMQELQSLTRSLSGRSSLTENELDRLARAQIAACAGTLSAECNSQASNVVQSLFETVCARQVGAAPAAGDEFAKLKYDTMKASCMSKSLGVVLNVMDEQAKAAIRHIKP